MHQIVDPPKPCSKGPPAPALGRGRRRGQCGLNPRCALPIPRRAPGRHAKSRPSADALVEPQSGRGLLQQRRRRGLAGRERLAPQVVAVELDQFGSCRLSSALTFLTSVGRTADSQTCSYLQAASASDLP
jgi:hypothetical protein